jgi:hypothetical protein
MVLPTQRFGEEAPSGRYVAFSRQKEVDRRTGVTTADPGATSNQPALGTARGAFFGTSEFIFDPRVVYDRDWQRWVLVASRQSTSSNDTVRRFFLLQCLRLRTQPAPQDFKIVRQSAIRGNTGVCQSNFSRSSKDRSHGCFNTERQLIKLVRYFSLDDSDRVVIDEHRGDHNRLGFAVQLCTARLLNTFLENLSEYPFLPLAFLRRTRNLRVRARR